MAAPPANTRKPWLRRMTAAAVVVIAVRILTLDTYRVIGDSMAPSFQAGDQLIVDRLIFAIRDPRRWEPVVFAGSDGVTYLKRVVGLPGETVQLIDGVVHINGEPVCAPGPPVRYDNCGRHAIHHSHRLDEDEFFVLGDNSAASSDSRHWPDPAVRRSALVGRPLWRRHAPAGTATGE